MGMVNFFNALFRCGATLVPLPFCNPGSGVTENTIPLCPDLGRANPLADAFRGIEFASGLDLPQDQIR